MPFTDEQRSAENCNLSMIYTVKKEEPNDFLLMVQWLEHRLLLQNTWVQFPECKPLLTPSGTVPGDGNPFPDFCRHQAPMYCIYIHEGKALMHINKCV